MSSTVPKQFVPSRSFTRLVAVAATIALLLALTPAALAQTDQARIAGSVMDAQGAVIPGATVVVRSNKTGAERTATANERGYFIVINLLPATYKVTVSATGLATAAYENVVLAVGQERSLNIVLQPPTLQQEVTVSSDTVVINTSSARVGVNVGEREVSQLPMNGRQVSQLYLLSPGAVNYGSGTFDDIRFSGRANEQNAVRFDGVEGGAVIDANPGNLNGENTSVFRLQASLENVQEFRVESSNYTAEFGTGSGGQISVITKSGSNAWHGGLFEFDRNTALDARNFFDGANSSILKVNQFGGSLGGPLVKDKAFFFASYEGLRQRTSVPIVESTLSAAARARAVPSIRSLLAAFPVGNAGPSANPDLDLINVQGPGHVNENYGGVRFDFNPSSKYRMYLRYFRDQGESGATQNSTGSTYVTSATPQNAVLSLSQMLAPTMINETKFGVNAYKTRVSGIPGPSPGVDLSGTTINLSGSVALSGIAGQAGSAGVAIPTGLIRLSSAFNGRGAPYTNYSMSFIDNLSAIKGNHNIKVGMEVRPLRMYNDQQGGTTYSFSNINAFLNNQPSQIQYIGDLSKKSPFTGLDGWLNMHQVYYIGYAQDEWKLTRHLTMNYGLRYEYYSVLHEIHNKNVIFNMLTGGFAPANSDYYHSSPNNFGPRLSFAWSPERFKDKTAFRIGAGYYYGPGQSEDQIQPAANDRISKTISSGSLLAYPLDVNALVAGYDINSPTLGYQPRAYAPGYTIPERILSYTASVQQQLPGNMVWTSAYVGAQGRNLFLRSITNKIVAVDTNPTTGAAIITREFGNRFAEIDYKTSGGTSHYNSFQNTLNRRFANGLTLNAQYTWAHDIGNTGGSNEARTSANNYSFAADYGNNTFDVRQSFNMSALYQLPLGRGRKYGRSFNGVADAVLGGWQLGGIVNARSGLPIEVLITRPDVVYKDTRTGLYYNSAMDANGGNPATTGLPPVTVAVINVPGGGNSRNIRRPDLIAGVNPYMQGADKRIYLNPAAFTIPRPGTFGNLGRNAFKGPGLAQLDLTLEKRFRLNEKFNLEFRSELYNILNHANFKAPSGGQPNVTNALGVGKNLLQPGQPFTAAAAGGTWGQLTDTVSNLVGLGTNRQVQLSLRLNF